MIRIVLWAILFGMLFGIFVKMEEVDGFTLLVHGGIGLLLISYIREFIREHNLNCNLKDLW